MKANQFKLLQKRYTYLLVFQIIVAVISMVVVLILRKTFSDDVSLDRILQLIAVLLGFGCGITGFQLYKRKVLELRESNLPAQQKMDAYTSISTVFWILLLVPALFCALCYVITGNFAFIALFALLVFAFGSQNPFKSKVVLLLKLSKEESEVLSGELV